jgi:hypothetical protein
LAPDTPFDVEVEEQEIKIKASASASRVFMMWYYPRTMYALLYRIARFLPVNSCVF